MAPRWRNSRSRQGSFDWAISCVQRALLHPENKGASESNPENTGARFRYHNRTGTIVRERRTPARHVDQMARFGMNVEAHPTLRRCLHVCSRAGRKHVMRFSRHAKAYISLSLFFHQMIILNLNEEKVRLKRQRPVIALFYWNYSEKYFYDRFLSPQWWFRWTFVVTEVFAQENELLRANANKQKSKAKRIVKGL